MPYQNISATFPNPTWITVQQKFAEIEALLPSLINLAKGEKKKGLRMGKKAEKFFFDVQKITDQSPQFAPGYINLPEYTKDFELFLNLSLVELKLQQLTEAVTDTRIAVGQECMVPALAIYENIKTAARNNAPGADTFLKALQPYFKKERKKKKGG
jgi:hypothetical protein